MRDQWDRYRLFIGRSEEHYVSKRPVYTSNLLSGLCVDVQICLRQKQEWYVLDAHKSFSVVDPETVLRVCGIKMD